MSPRKEVLAEGVEIWLGDCREILPTLGKVDAVVTDPPYGIGITRSNRLSVSRGHSGSWDDEAADVAPLLALDVPTIIWGGNYFDVPPSRCVLVWDKNNAGRDFADVEIAWTNLDQVARRFMYRPMNMDGGKLHPTQKPVELMAWCLSFVSGTVLDPFMGSGSTGVACVQVGSDFIGIEREPRYFDVACRRIADELSRPRLFVEKPAVPRQEALL
jgi:site-specific DNA-methyltransferase (adenine-specific)